MFIKNILKENRVNISSKQIWFFITSITFFATFLYIDFTFTKSSYLKEKITNLRSTYNLQLKHQEIISNLLPENIIKDEKSVGSNQTPIALSKLIEELNTNLDKNYIFLEKEKLNQDSLTKNDLQDLSNSLIYKLELKKPFSISSINLSSVSTIYTFIPITNIYDDFIGYLISKEKDNGLNHLIITEILKFLFLSFLIVIGIFIYIHLQRRNEENIKIFHQYQDIIDKSVIVSKTNPQGIITYVNKQFCKISGYTKEELIGNSHNIVRHPDSTIPFFRQMWKTILAKNTWQGVIKNRSKNGENYYVHSTIAPILNDKNEIVEFIALREDITNLINRTNELKSEKVILNNFFNHIDEILIIKRDNRFEQISQKFFDLFAIENLQEFNHQYKCISNLFIPKDGYLEFSKEFNWIKEVVNNPNKIYKALMKDKQEKIRTFWVRVQKIPFEKTYYYLFILTDITLLENESLKEDSKNIIKKDIKSENSFQLFEKTKEALKLPDKIIFNLIDKFITNTKETTVKLNEALKSGQIDLVKIFAHNIKGSASTLRFEEISSLAKEIEDNLENDTEQMNKLEKINQLLEIIEEELKRVELYDK